LIIFISGEKSIMANKKKIEERERMLQAHKNERRIRMIGVGVVIVVLLLLVYMLVNNGGVPGAEPPAPTLPAETTAPVATENAGAPANSKQYDSYPPMTIDTAKKYFATVKMAKGGEFVLQLFPDKAPLTVNSFVFLARDGYFDGVTFHRVLEGFMAQGGDPTGTGSGGPGYEFVNEDSDLTFDKPGVVAMANAGRDTNGSQFFITFGAADFLNGGYTIFGQVTEGMDVVNGITRRDPDQFPDYPGDAIETITINEE
jgi:cyclophilin family peptidyl-prolyl cis-trans isomerase/Na+-transporting methylmalonyl-CoA/oxaloacetate decarboxylase gamma subunit